MQYRTLPHGGEQISILGLGTSSIQFAEEKEIEETICLAIESGSIILTWHLQKQSRFPAMGALWQENGIRYIFRFILEQIILLALMVG